MSVCSQLMGEAETLRLVSQLLQSIDKISGVDAESWAAPHPLLSVTSEVKVRGQGRRPGTLMKLHAELELQSFCISWWEVKLPFSKRFKIFHIYCKASVFWSVCGHVFLSKLFESWTRHQQGCFHRKFPWKPEEVPALENSLLSCSYLKGSCGSQTAI